MPRHVEEASKAVIRFVPSLPSIREVQNSEVPFPTALTTPRPHVRYALAPGNFISRLLPRILPKRLIEVDLPIKRISAHARREKSIHKGHISAVPRPGGGSIITIHLPLNQQVSADE